MRVILPGDRLSYPDNHYEVAEENNGAGETKQPQNSPLRQTDLSILTQRQSVTGTVTGTVSVYLESPPLGSGGCETENVDGETEDPAVVKVAGGPSPALLLRPVQAAQDDHDDGAGGRDQGEPVGGHLLPLVFLCHHL